MFTRGFRGPAPIILSARCVVKTPRSPLSLLSFCDRGGNLTLLHFLLGLKTAADDELVAELVVNILKVCPDLLNKYFKEVTFSFLPRLKSTWSNNIRLLNKVTTPAFRSLPHGAVGEV